jgi:hypothetical protein
VVILKWIFKKSIVETQTGISRPGYGQMAGAFECDNKVSDSMKCGKFVDYLRVCQLFKKESAPCG